MGLFWDLIQQSQLSDHAVRAESLEDRVASLEEQVRNTNRTLAQLLQLLETRFGEDLDGDGQIG